MCIYMKANVIYMFVWERELQMSFRDVALCFIIFMLLTVKCFSYVDSNFTHFVNGDIFYIFYLHYIFANLVLLYCFFCMY